MISEKLSLWFSRRTQWVFSVAIGVLAIAFIISMSSMNIAQNVESRALSELQSTVGMQASAVTDHMSGQFQALQLVANMLANGRYFVSEELQPTLTSVVDTFRLCTLCLADTDGNTTDYLGNILGSCSDREYFREIIDGSHTQICEYLAATKLTSEPRGLCQVFCVNSYPNSVLCYQQLSYALIRFIR